MKLLKSPFERITSGKKTIEIRLNDEKRQKLQIGDTIVFCKLPDLKEEVQVEITKLLKYNSFRELLDTYGMKYYGFPNDYSKDDFLNEIYNIYTPQQEKKDGVLGIKFIILK